MTNREIAPARLLATFLTAACAVAPGCRKPAPSQPSGIDLAGMDKSVPPGDDFNAYANAGWLKATPIPADKASYGIGAILSDETRTRTRALIEDAAKSSGGSADYGKVGAYFAS